MSLKRKQHEEHHIDETWLIPYADLLTLLLALFILLFASSSIDAKKFDMIIEAFSSAFNSGTGVLEHTSAVPLPVVEQITESIQRQDTRQDSLEQTKNAMDLRELKKEIDQYIHDHQLETQVETRLNKNQLMITLRDHAFFASGSAAITPDAKALGHAISEMLAKYPKFEIMVAGHTDNRPIRTAEFESNWDLSTERALNFMKILLQNSKLNPANFRAVGFGEYHPIDTNATEEGRAKNRRVEISILTPTQQIEQDF